MQNIIEELRGTCMNEYFAFGKLILIDYVSAMINFAQDITNTILEEMIKDHKRTNIRICEEFEELKEFALRIPTSTEQLMQSGARMVWANTEFLEEVKVSTVLYMLIEKQLILTYQKNIFSEKNLCVSRLNCSLYGNDNYIRRAYKT